ncbi:MAG: WD40/YVTN/BNR-like repeat-containing protein [Bacteroidota bacterium]
MSDKVIWASGSLGTVLRSTNGGENFEKILVPGYEQRDFRDIEAFDEKTAIIMAVDTPAVMLKTTDGGKTWIKVFEDKRPGMFLDAMEFWNERSGIVVGDPLEGKIFIARTFDGGATWRGLPEDNYPIVKDGESFFAASGTNVTKRNKQEAVFVTGGLVSRLFIREQSIELPFTKGSNTIGANSVAVNKRGNMIIVGGDYKDASNRNNLCFIYNKKENKISIPMITPFGYRSCVIYLTESKAITCGLSGVDVSEDGGITWKNISSSGYHVVKKAKKGKSVFLAGTGGRIDQLIW